MTESPPPAACVFDAYGTLFDVASAVNRCRAQIGDQADAFSATWRRYQLETTWLRSLMGRYEDFWQVTGQALDHAMALHGLTDLGLRAHLMELYLRLDPYPEVAEVLATIRRGHLKTAILSNGSPTMLAAAADSARLRPLLDVIVSVDSLRIYKPHPSVYQLACDRLSLDASRIVFVSGNGWDVAGAGCFGLRVAWLNRAGLPREPLPGPPWAELRSLRELPERLGL